MAEIEKIELVDQGEAKTENEKPSRTTPSKEQFDRVLDPQDSSSTTPTLTEEKITNPPSLDNLVRSTGKTHDSRHLTAEEIAEQTRIATDRIDQVKQTLETSPALESAYKPLLRNKLAHIDESLQIAVSKAGLETQVASSEFDSQTLMNPIERFLGGLSHAQNQLHDLGNVLASMGQRKEEISTANMMAIQIKVQHVQQELEFFSNLLNQAMQASKTLMNVQV
jgi:hypothetical protein